jgi:hypothetical protein
VVQSDLGCSRRTERSGLSIPPRQEPAELLRAEFEGLPGKLGPLLERTLEDRSADRCDCVQAVRSDRGGDRNCGRKQLNQLARKSIVTFRTNIAYFPKIPFF